MYRLSNRKILKVNGDNLLQFFQGLITQDASLLNSRGCIYTAMLLANGRFLLDFFAIKASESELLIDIADIFSEKFIETVNKYKLRQKIFIQVDADLTVIVADKPLDGAIFTFQDPRSEKLGIRNIIPANLCDEFRDISDEIAYNSLLINNCIVDGRFIPQEKGIILEYNFEEIQGINFDKGCYLGQELMTRTKRTGQIRKRLQIASLKDIEPETAITHDNTNALVFVR